MFRVLLKLLLLSLLANKLECAKILGFVAAPSYSHFLLTSTILKELAKKGHDVTIITTLPENKTIKNYREVPINEIMEQTVVPDMKKKLYDMESQNFIQNFQFLLQTFTLMNEKVYQSKNLQNLFNSGEKFDLVLVEYLFNEALVGLAYKFDAPLVLLLPAPGLITLNEFLSEPNHFAVNLNSLFDFTHPMGFFTRIQNFFMNSVYWVLNEAIVLPAHRKIFNKYVTNDTTLDNVLYNTSLLLTNSHYSINSALAHVPNVIEIGGYHVAPLKGLPADLKKYLDESKEGVVLFSMGSNLKSADLSEATRNILLKSLSKIKQKVLWKFETDLSNLPKNVKIMKWIPQQDVLAHPNVKAFISHGGLLSTIETVYNGVPIIGIPIFGDQKSNIASAVAGGYAVSVPFKELSEEKLDWALKEILDNPKYTLNVKQRSKIMNDQPIKPLDKAVFWIEYVIRHKGAPHLKFVANYLTWYQQISLDVIAFLLTATFLTLFVIYRVLRKVLRAIFKPKTSLSKRKKKTN